jgi:hypothetical protein
MDLAGVEVEADVIEGNHTGEPFGHVGELENWRRSRRLRRHCAIGIYDGFGHVQVGSRQDTEVLHYARAIIAARERVYVGERERFFASLGMTG